LTSCKKSEFVISIWLSGCNLSSSVNISCMIYTTIKSFSLRPCEMHSGIVKSSYKCIVFTSEMSGLFWSWLIDDSVVVLVVVAWSLRNWGSTSLISDVVRIHQKFMSKSWSSSKACVSSQSINFMLIRFPPSFSLFHNDKFHGAKMNLLNSSTNSPKLFGFETVALMFIVVVFVFVLY
jgi:hypothetical protein